MTKKLLLIHPGNIYPDHDNLVAVVARTRDGQLFLVHDRRLGKKSWLQWADIVAWQELPEVTKCHPT